MHSTTLLKQAPPVIVSAALIILAAPPFNLWPLALIALVPLYLTIKQCSAPRAAALAGATWFAAVLGVCPWWGPTLERFAGLSAPEALGLALLLSAYQALAFALWGGLAAWAAPRMRGGWLVAAPLAIVLAESAVPFFFKHYLALTVWKAWPLIQVAELGGPVAVSALVVLFNVVIAECFLSWRLHARPHRAVATGAVVLCAVLLLSGARAWQVSRAAAAAPVLRAGLVQPNVGQPTVLDRKLHGMDYVRDLRAATKRLGDEGAELVVWPESAWPYLFDRTLEREFPAGHPWELRKGYAGRLLAGVLSHTFGGTTVYNSAVLVAEDGAIAGRYDKNLLVPFAEYIPFDKQFPQWARDLREKLPEWPKIEVGREPVVVSDGSLRLGALICSEELCPTYVAAIARQKPNLLVSLASDAWFGQGATPELHFGLSVFRAVETRRALLRATNTGISAMVDPLGRVVLEGEDAGASDRRTGPTELRADAPLMEAAALGPYTLGAFPFACAVWMICALVARAWAREQAVVETGNG